MPSKTVLFWNAFVQLFLGFLVFAVAVTPPCEPLVPFGESGGFVAAERSALEASGVAVRGIVRSTAYVDGDAARAMPVWAQIYNAAHGSRGACVRVLRASAGR
jgi:hypothetical protein